MTYINDSVGQGEGSSAGVMRGTGDVEGTGDMEDMEDTEDMEIAKGEKEMILIILCNVVML